MNLLDLLLCLDRNREANVRPKLKGITRRDPADFLVCVNSQCNALEDIQECGTADGTCESLMIVVHLLDLLHLEHLLGMIRLQTIFDLGTLQVCFWNLTLADFEWGSIKFPRVCFRDVAEQIIELLRQREISRTCS